MDAGGRATQEQLPRGHGEHREFKGTDATKLENKAKINEKTEFTRSKRVF